tara:strand:- start:19 stop:585 length:567 start_codon:yes stop_codon:yes gene_type:complete
MAVRSHKDSHKVRRLVRDLPKLLTNQKVTPELEKLRNLFWAFFAKEFYRLAYKNFKLKSQGGSDEFGVRWKPLKPSTIKRRAESGLRSLVARRNAMGGDVANNLILVRSGRLRESFKPGKQSGASYIPANKDQLYVTTSGRVQLGSNVPYADDQNEERPLLGDEAELINKAMEVALEKFLKELQRELL